MKDERWKMRAKEPLAMMEAVTVLHPCYDGEWLSVPSKWVVFKESLLRSLRALLRAWLEGLLSLLLSHFFCGENFLFFFVEILT